MPAFERIFTHYSFELTWSQQGLYVPTTTELGFNGAPIPDKATEKALRASFQPKT